jgi:hypothetical protein
LRILQEQEPTNFARIFTGDESWFFLEYFWNRVWRLGEENTPERVSQKLNIEKHTLTIFWSTMGRWLRNDCQNMTHLIAHTSVRLLSRA